MNIAVCDMIKMSNDFLNELITIRTAAMKQKDWSKQKLMTMKSDKKININDENVLRMIWINLNIVQYMIIVYTINKIKTMIYFNVKRRNEIFKSMICDEKLSFSTSIVEYNRHMNESNENAQQRTYYSSHRFDNYYWWSLFIFLLNATVLNAYKLWNRFYSQSKLTHSKFQYQIAETLLINEITRKHASIVSIFEASDKSISCKWKHSTKKSYCELCKKKKIRLRKRRAFEKISANFIKKRRTSQINWECKSCDLCCKKKDCWRVLHSIWMHNIVTSQLLHVQMCENYQRIKCLRFDWSN